MTQFQREAWVWRHVVWKQQMSTEQEWNCLNVASVCHVLLCRACSIVRTVWYKCKDGKSTVQYNYYYHYYSFYSMICYNGTIFFHTFFSYQATPASGCVCHGPTTWVWACLGSPRRPVDEAGSVAICSKFTLSWFDLKTETRPSEAWSLGIEWCSPVSAIPRDSKVDMTASR